MSGAVSFRAIIFDLDDTLLDTRALKGLRDARRWGECFAQLDRAAPFGVEAGETPVEELPSQVTSRGMSVGLLTHSPTPYATGLLQRFGIQVQAMVTGSDGFDPKPNPSGLEAVARALGVPAAECLYVGDTVGDFGAAAGARMASAGVAWDGEFPTDWRRAWPDVAVASTTRLLQVIDGDDQLHPIGDALAAGGGVEIHRGSLLRLGGTTYGLGRYFNTSDWRHPGHALTQLVLSAKSDPTNAERVADIFEVLARDATARPPALVVSVPPPAGGYDRFAPSRARLAEAWNARDGDGVLRMRFEVDDYKSLSWEQRRAQNVDRFESEELTGENVVLIDDVITSGGQAEACRDVLKASGAGVVSIVALSVAQEALVELCPLCNGRLRTIPGVPGRYGPFIGCTSWFTTGCPYKRDL